MVEWSSTLIQNYYSSCNIASFDLRSEWKYKLELCLNFICKCSTVNIVIIYNFQSHVFWLFTRKSLNASDKETRCVCSFTVKIHQVHSQVVSSFTCGYHFLMLPQQTEVTFEKWVTWIHECSMWLCSRCFLVPRFVKGPFEGGLKEIARFCLKCVCVGLTVKCKGGWKCDDHRGSCDWSWDIQVGRPKLMLLFSQKKTSLLLIFSYIIFLENLKSLILKKWNIL